MSLSWLEISVIRNILERSQIFDSYLEIIFYALFLIGSSVGVYLLIAAFVLVKRGYIECCWKDYMKTLLAVSVICLTKTYLFY